MAVGRVSRKVWEKEEGGQTVVAEGRVCGDVDALLLAVLDEVVLGEVGVGFNLVHGLQHPLR